MWPFESGKEKEQRLELERKKKAISALNLSIFSFLIGYGLKIRPIFDTPYTGTVLEWRRTENDFCFLRIKYCYGSLHWELCFDTSVGMMEKIMAEEFLKLYVGAIKGYVDVSHSEKEISSVSAKKVTGELSDLMEQANRTYAQSEMMRKNMNSIVRETCIVEAKSFIEKYA